MSTETTDAPAKGDMSLIEHLKELRNRLLLAAVAIVIGAVVGWIFYEKIFSFLTVPYCDVVEAKRQTCA